MSKRVATRQSKLPVPAATVNAAAKKKTGLNMPDPKKNDPEAPGGENLEKVRELLFGSQLRDQDKRFARLEERIAKELSDVRDESRRRLDSLESYIKKEIQGLIERIKTEQIDRADADKELTQEHRESIKAVEKRLNQVDERAGTIQRELREEILEQSKVLRDEMRKSHQDLAAAADRSTAELRADKVDRTLMAEVLTEMAVRLNSDGEAA
jgi:hypothetical protein